MIQNKLPKTTLTKLKKDLYGENHPLLYSKKSLTEENFLQLFFPSSFYKDSFSDKKGRVFSLKTLLTKRNKSTSQRNKIFNGKYTGYALRDNVVGIFTLQPDFWTQIVLNCKKELGKIENSTPVFEYLNNIIENEIDDIQLSQYLKQVLDETPEVAFAVIIIYLLLNGKMKIDDNDSFFIDFFTSASFFHEQFRYMDNTCPMLKSMFGQELRIQDFQIILDNFYDKYANLLSYVTTVKVNNNTLNYDHLFNSLLSEIYKMKSKKLISILGAAGTEKNAITQLLYLKIACETQNGNNTIFAPYYINLNYYDRKYQSNFELIKTHILRDYKIFYEYCCEHPNRSPLLFIDGIKQYSLDDCNIDYLLEEIIENNPEIYLVLAIEKGAITNPVRQRKTPFYTSGDFSCKVQIDSIYISDQKIAIPYLNQFKVLYCPENKRSIYDQLKAVGINRIDTSQLKMLLPRLWDTSNISELYEAVCSDYLKGDQSELSIAAQWAFDFAYTDKVMPSISRKLKVLLNYHDSIQEFFIARWYLSKIREGTMQDNIGMLDMVMPKGVTRFIVPMLNRSAADETHILDLIEQNYHRMGLMAQSEMTYWLGRIKSPSMAIRAERMLERYYENQKKLLANTRSSDANYKQILFLMRGISVSLIVKGHMDVSDEYITSLINDGMANEINRGFHLEYYGDKAYLPAYDTLDFMDDITQGKHTLDQLIATNEIVESTFDIFPMFELNLFTICSLLQARVESFNPNVTFNLIPYMEKALNQAKWYLNNYSNIGQMFKEYLKVIIRDFTFRIHNKDTKWGSIGATVYNIYSTRIPRTGWCIRGVKTPETIAEHMYHAWMMGMMFLPDSYPGYNEYSKETILNLLLIHDIAEAITGDIEKPKKKTNLEYYDQKESEEMGMFFLRGSYPSMANIPNFYNTWQLWNDSRNINGRIAKEIDIIQTLFQLLTYVNEFPSCFDDSDIQKWLQERKEIRTAPGINILKTVIIENDSFQYLLSKYGIISTNNSKELSIEQYD